jgi:hypothetical protein
MNTFQQVILANKYNNLYNLIAAFADARAEGADSVLLWAKGEKISLLQDIGELEVLDRYARKFNLRISLSAAENPPLCRMASQLGWHVNWQIQGLDSILLGHSIQREANQWVVAEEEEEASWQVAG